MLYDLVRYYDKLFSEGKVPPFGYRFRSVSYLVDLDPGGNVNDIVDIRVFPEPLKNEKTGKVVTLKPYGKRFCVPDELPSNSSNVYSYYLWGKAEYCFPCLVEKKFQCMVALHKKFLVSVGNRDAMALSRYFSNAVEVDFKAYGLDIDKARKEGANFSFSVEGRCVLDDRSLLDAWEQRELVGPLGISCLSGEKQVLRLGPQPKIPFRGGIASGMALISRDSDSYAFNSHGGSVSLEKGSDIYRGGRMPVGWLDAHKYASALYYLLDYSSEHSRIFGDMTVLFWGDSPYDDLIFDVGTDSVPLEDITDTRLRALFENLRDGKDVEDPGFLDTPFHVCGFLPNSARVLWAFDWCDTYGYFLRNGLEHQRNLYLEGFDKPVPLSLIPLLASPNGKTVPNARNVYKNLMYSVVHGRRYPMELLPGLLRRLREKAAATRIRDTRSGKVVKNFLSITNGMTLAGNYFRYLGREVSVLKAYLIRNFNKGDVILPMLNKDNPSIAYQLGRLFAICQLDVRSRNPEDRKNMQKVKERWIRSASTTPAKVYGPFLRSANIHKASNIRIQEIFERIDPANIPARFSLEEELMWWAGYEHQCSAYFKEAMEKKKEREEKERKEKGQAGKDEDAAGEVTDDGPDTDPMDDMPSLEDNLEDIIG